MDIFVTIITNASFIAIATLILKHFLSRDIQRQKGKIDNSLEKLRTELQLKSINEQEILNRKRQVYIELVDSMAIFIGNRVPVEKTDEYKQKFLKAYDIAWLWASDSVIKAMSEYMQLKLENITGDREKEAFSKCVLAMRKDIVDSPNINPEDYKFILF